MERRSGLACLVVMMMLCVGAAGEFQTSSLGDMAKCYGPVFSICMLTNNQLYCTGKAFRDCYANATGSGASTSSVSRSASNDGVIPNRQFYCELGCALSRCTNNTTTQLDSNEEQLGKCFESCTENCIPNTNVGNGEQTSDEFCKLGCAKSLCGETADKDTVCGPCDTACSNISFSTGRI